MKFLKETLNSPANLTSYIKNLKAPMPKYVYGFSQEKVMNFVNGLPMREDKKLRLKKLIELSRIASKAEVASEFRNFLQINMMEFIL